MKTYSRFTTNRRRPSEYEIVSTGLVFNYPSNFELSATSPVIRWYEENREGSRLRVSDWETFSDPRATTYRGYTALQSQGEGVVDGLLNEIDETGYDDDLDAEWVHFLHENYFPLRYPVHGLEMLAAYVGQMAPSSRLMNCAAFQTGDELRRLQRIAYRAAQLDAHRPGDELSTHRARWEEDMRFQPLRELVERALTRYDWAEALVILNVVIKPRLDRWINDELAGLLANRNGDPILRSIHFSLDRDSRWHWDWTKAALKVALADDPANGDLIEQWAISWRDLADSAVDSLAEALPLAPQPADRASTVERVITAAQDGFESLWV
jgi:toluene monooxygenase system protein E